MGTKDGPGIDRAYAEVLCLIRTHMSYRISVSCSIQRLFPYALFPAKLSRLERGDGLYRCRGVRVAGYVRVEEGVPVTEEK
jgi:hypothetical protein